MKECVTCFFNESSNAYSYTYGHTLSLHAALPSYDCSLARRLADDAQAGDRAHLLGQVRQQFLFARGDIVHAQRIEVVDRGAEADVAGDVRRAGLEAARWVAEVGAVVAHFVAHLAAAQDSRPARAIGV